MARAMIHRGPDASEIIHPNDRWTLGANRLAIQDQTAPCLFHSADGRYSTGCNGEIYNWKELRSELEHCGYTFSTRCDSEILPAAWAHWGERLFPMLNGMFALWIYDHSDDCLILARDRCGQKPLYFTTAESFTFASEIRGLTAAGLMLRADPTTLFDYLQLRYVPEPQTLYQGVQMLPAGHSMTVDSDGNTRIASYWEPVFAERRRREPTLHLVEELGHLTQQAVDRCAHPDTPYAVYLSGGVDSALLTSHLATVNPPTAAISLGFGAAGDETPQAAETARDFGIPFHSVQLSPADLSSLPRVARQMERPVGDLLTLAFDALAQKSRSLGCPVAIGGEGADELFAGYSFQKAQRWAAMMPPPLRQLAAAGLGKLSQDWIDRLAAFPASLGQSGRQKVAQYLAGYSSANFYERSIGLRSLFSPQELSELLVPDLIPETHSDLPDICGARNDLERGLGAQFTSWLQDWALIRQDKNAMAHSVEYRAPFLDNDLIDFSFELPLSQKLKGRDDKAIWRKMASQHLPKTSARKQKVPFYLPLESPEWRAAVWQLFDSVLVDNRLEESGWFRPGAIDDLVARARHSSEFLPMKQLASLVILSFHLDACSDA